MLVFFTGLFAGTLHVLSGPDHVAAIAPLALRTPRAGGTLGAVWGIGHGGGVAAWLVLAALLRAGLRYEPPTEALEALVGLALMALGAGTFFLPQRGQTASPSTPRKDGRATALLLGALHGSAGATHLLALLPTLGLPTAGIVSYGAGYLLAGVLAMAGVAGLLGTLSEKLRSVVEPDRLRRACAVLVFAVGAAWSASAVLALATMPG